ALSGEETARFRDPDGDDYAVKVRLPMEQADGAARNALSALNGVYVPTADGLSARLDAIATPTLKSSPARIDRFDRERTVTITSYVSTGYLAAKVTEDAAARMARDLPMPPGYRLSLGGQAEAQSESFSGLGAA
ncbi:efflux RND transporter permease subunit, partial [Caulobacter sp. HMWF009]